HRRYRGASRHAEHSGQLHADWRSAAVPACPRRRQRSKTRLAFFCTTAHGLAPMMPQPHYMGFVWRVLCLAALSTGFGGAAAAQTAPRPSLAVTPSSSVNISGPQGGPFSPGSIQYRLSASTGTLKFAITAPVWLTADPRVGAVGIDGVTVKLQLNPR